MSVKQKLKPTAEQEATIEAALNGDDLRIKAFAGAAKSSTLVMIANAFDGRGGAVGMYLAFNKAIATEAQSKFPSSVECRTVHSLAYKYTPMALKKKISYGKIISTQYAKMYDFKGSMLINGDVKRSISLGAKWTMVTRTVAKYCNSADSELLESHVGMLEWMYTKHGFDLTDLKAEVFALAKRLWADTIDPDSQVPLSHDAYLKLFSETGRKLPITYLMVDECQDSNPVILKLVSNLQCQKIFVGDDFQSVYAFRNAINAMDMVDGKEMYLTKSFRFGDNISELANSLLKYSGCQVPLVGNGSSHGVTASVFDDNWIPDCVITRTNSGVLKSIFTYAMKYPKLSIGASFDAQVIYKFVEAYEDVCNGLGTQHPMLMMFDSKFEVLEYAKENPDDTDVVNIVAMVEQYGSKAVIDAVKRCETNKRPSLMITTAHKSKGLEWDKVRLADDFKVVNKEGVTNDQQEINLLYVAVTRAKLDIDISGIILGLDMIAASNGDKLGFVGSLEKSKILDSFYKVFKNTGVPTGVRLSSFDCGTDKDIQNLFWSVKKSRADKFKQEEYGRNTVDDDLYNFEDFNPIEY